MTATIKIQDEVYAINEGELSGDTDGVYAGPIEEYMAAVRKFEDDRPGIALTDPDLWLAREVVAFFGGTVLDYSLSDARDDLVI